jgi:hypothetical protein
VRPDYVRSAGNRGNTLLELVRFDEALESHGRALAVRPDYADSHWNMSLLDLLLVWSGRATHKNDHNRSISLRSLLPLLDVNASFVSLQTDVRPDDAAVLEDQCNLAHFGDKLQTFSDTAAVISNLDLVISVDTSVAHRPGVVAKPV